MHNRFCVAQGRRPIGVRTDVAYRRPFNTEQIAFRAISVPDGAANGKPPSGQGTNERMSNEAPGARYQRSHDKCSNGLVAPEYIPCPAIDRQSSTSASIRR